MQPVCHVKGGLREGGPRRVVEGATGAEVRDCEVESVDVVALFGEVIETEDPVEPIVSANQLQFLRELLLIQCVLKLRDAVWRVIAIASKVRLQLSICGDGLESKAVREIVADTPNTSVSEYAGAVPSFLPSAPM
jgi:hypothetical protein